ncbi:MAG: tetratricopeptide repeat protein [Acidobacteria bacterium]|nr:tetratricopeptide repeat protein [Acidobacteriota bacterium]
MGEQNGLHLKGKGLLWLQKIALPLMVCSIGWRCVAPLRAQDIVAEPNLQLFTVLAAINAAGYEGGMQSSELSALRAGIRQELAQRKIPTLPALRDFYQSHRLEDPGRELSQYVSLALFLSGPPSFGLEQSPVNLPPEVWDLREMVPLLAAFYQEADLASLWEKSLPLMEEESEKYRKFLAQVIQETTGYLRLDTSGTWSRRFAIYSSPLGASNQTNARIYGNIYYIVVGPSAGIPEEEIQHGWLHFLLDPLPFRYPREVGAKAELLKIAQRAPALDDAFRKDFDLLLTESLIRAILARRSRADAEAKRRAVQDAMQEGYFLTGYFFEALEKFEQQPVGMRLYYPEMIGAISVPHEQERSAQVQFLAQPSRPREEIRRSSLDQMLRLGEENIALGQYEQARQIFASLLQQYGQQSQVLYGLGIVASQQKQPQEAKEYFQQAASLASDPHIKAWSHIYRGRLFDVEGDRAAALAEYSAALAAGDPSGDTRAAAEKGLEERFSPQDSASPPLAEEPPGEGKPHKGEPLGKEKN